MGKLSTIPIIGKYFYHYVYEHFSLSYDVIVNFIGAHEAADNMLKSVIESKKFVDYIVLEGNKQVMNAEEYMVTNIEEMFPEVSKAIQFRRAQYYLLVHEYTAVDKMLKQG